MEIAAFKAELEKLCLKYYYKQNYQNDRIVCSRDGTLLTVSFEFFKEQVSVYLYARTTSWDAGGERTDLNDVLSTLPALFLRLHDLQISCTLLDLEHPMGQGKDGAIRAVELYARYIIFSQPYVDSLLPRSEESLNVINRILSAITEYEFSLYYFMDHSEELSATYSHDDEDLISWVNTIVLALNENIEDRSITYNRRVNPNWYYFRSIRSNLSIVFAPKTAMMLKNLYEHSKTISIYDNGTFKFFKSELTLNACTTKSLNLLKKALFALEGDQDEVCLIPCDNRIIGVSGKHIFFREGKFDRKMYLNGKNSIIARRKKEQDFIFDGKTYTWNEKIDGGRFEDFIRELLIKREGVVSVRKTSITNEPDANADLICLWDAPSLADMPQNQNIGPVVRRKVVVQCKAWARNIGKNDVPNIRDTLDRHDASGMLIVVSSSVTRSLTEHIYAIRKKGIWADFWDRGQLEDYLDESPELIKKYPDIVRYTES